MGSGDDFPGDCQQTKCSPLSCSRRSRLPPAPPPRLSFRIKHSRSTGAPRRCRREGAQLLGPSQVPVESGSLRTSVWESPPHRTILGLSPKTQL